MRILGGKFKGRNFYMPHGIRPTQDRLRKAVFDILGQDLEGVLFLDLFAGSGAVGLEAISRNAQKVVFVERETSCIEVIEENLEIMKVGRQLKGADLPVIIQQDVFSAIKQINKQGKKFDIIFLDPPFGQGAPKKSLKTLEAYDILHPSCFILIQHSKSEILPETSGRFLLMRRKKYGASVLTVYQGK